MASGAQDWVARTDLLLQTLSELIVRNKLGQYLMEEGHYNFLVAAEKTIVDITGTGIIYGGVIRSSGSDETKNDRVKLIIDEEETISSEFKTHLDWAIDLPGERPLFLTRYDLVNYAFALGITPGITFEKSVKIIYDCNFWGPFVYWDFHYATI